VIDGDDAMNSRNAVVPAGLQKRLDLDQARDWKGYCLLFTRLRRGCGWQIHRLRLPAGAPRPLTRQRPRRRAVLRAGPTRCGGQEVAPIQRLPIDVRGNHGRIVPKRRDGVLPWVLDRHAAGGHRDVIAAARQYLSRREASQGSHQSKDRGARAKPRSEHRPSHVSRRA
jgi:hypothetical protein